MGQVKAKLLRKLKKPPTSNHSHQSQRTKQRRVESRESEPTNRSLQANSRSEEKDVEVREENDDDENQQELYDEDPLLRKMHYQLTNDPQAFVLNNLLMSVQFFDNFDKNINELREHNISTNEAQVNQRLSQYQKHCIMPDTLVDLVNRSVQFCPKHQTGLIYTEPLHPHRYLVVYDNVDVMNPNESQEYSSLMDGPVYKCIAEDTAHHGYVKLNVAEIEYKKREKKPTEKVNQVHRSCSLNVDKLTRSDNSTVQAINKELISDRTYARPLSVPNAFASLGTSQEMTTSESDVDSSDYGYATITKHYTVKPIDVDDNKDEIDTVGLSKKCITTLEFEEEGDEDYGSSGGKKENEKVVKDGKKEVIPAKGTVYQREYLDSTQFVAHFVTIFGASDLGVNLGFTTQSISTAMQQGAVIYVDIKTKNFVKNYEITPCLMVTWPDIANDWKKRPRKIVVDPTTNIGYKWPTQGTINTVASLPCHIYPVGYTPKRSENPERSIQWRLTFPAVEKFLLTCLTHTQIRCYFFTLALFKSFIEPKETKLGLTTDHIRAHLFWECEKDFLRWPEVRLGEKLMSFLLELKTKLAVAELPDYFLTKRNLFENIPAKYLNVTNNKLHNIVENPVMHLLVALNNLKYVPTDYYPVLDYKRLYLILMNTDLNEMPTSYLVEKLKLLKTKSSQDLTPDEAYSSRHSLSVFTTDYDGRSERNERTDRKQTVMERRRAEKLDFWTRMREQEHLFSEMKRKRLNSLEKNNVNKKGLSVKTINLNIKPPTYLTHLQQGLILELFIDHFLQMATHCLKCHWYTQTVTYVQQIKRFIILFHSLKQSEEQEHFYLTELSNIEETMIEIMGTDEQDRGPPIPNRNSSERLRMKRLWGRNEKNIKERAHSLDRATFDKMSDNVSRTAESLYGSRSYTLGNLAVDNYRKEQMINQDSQSIKSSGQKIYVRNNPPKESIKPRKEFDEPQKFQKSKDKVVASDNDEKKIYSQNSQGLQQDPYERPKSQNSDENIEFEDYEKIPRIKINQKSTQPKAAVKKSKQLDSNNVVKNSSKSTSSRWFEKGGSKKVDEPEMEHEQIDFGHIDESDSESSSTPKVMSRRRSSS